MKIARRSYSLFALALAGAAGGVVALAGPLQPPEGAITSTHKTLTEVEPRIALGALTTPGDADSVFRITQRGSYYLTGNLSVGSGLVGIEIAAGGVTIDLNGFDILGAAGSLDGIRMTTGNQTSITIKNGSIRLMGQDAIDLETTPVADVRIEDLHASGNQGRGIALTSGIVESCSVQGSGAQGFFMETGTLRDCRSFENTGRGFYSHGQGASYIGCVALDNGSDGIYAGQSASVTSCVARGNVQGGIIASIGSSVKDCVADESGAHGFVLGPSSTISASSARGNGLNGILANADSLVTGNSCVSNGTAGLAAGIRLQGANSRLEGNNCVSSPRGIDVPGANNIIIRNTCASNTTNWVLAANNAPGPIINATALGAPAVNGNAGPDWLGSAHPNANFSY